MSDNETEDYTSPFIEFDKEWDKLSYAEKNICLVYAELLIRNVAPEKNIMILMNDIHKKYPEFHMGCVPFSL